MTQDEESHTHVPEQEMLVATWLLVKLTVLLVLLTIMLLIVTMSK